MHLPYAHRCEILNRDGKNFLFAATVSTYKENPQDWSNPGELHLIELDETPGAKWESRVIDKSVTRNHGMMRTRINGNETICISGKEGIFYLGARTRRRLDDPGQCLNREVSEMTFIDLDGDGQDELVTIEPFHGETLNIYKNTGNKWELRIQ